MHDTVLNPVVLYGVTIAVGVLMTRASIRQGVLTLRSEHRCVSCGTIVETRVCPRCGEAR